MNRLNRLTAWGLALSLGAGLMITPVAVRASEEGERNTALGLSAAAAALLLTQKNKLPGIIAGAGAAYAWKKSQDSINARHKREQRYGYNRDDYRYRDDNRYRDDYNYRDDYQYRDDYRYRDNTDYRDDYFRNRDREREDCDDNGRYANSYRRDKSRYEKNDRYRRDTPPYGRALGYYKRK